MFERGVGKHTGLSQGVLALSHGKKSEDFSKKNRRIFIKKNQLVNSPVCFPTGAFKHQIHRNLPSLGPAIFVFIFMSRNFLNIEHFLGIQ